MQKVKHGAIAEIYLDEGLCRMCCKYGIHPEKMMKAALMDELHAKAVSCISEKIGL